MVADIIRTTCKRKKCGYEFDVIRGCTICPRCGDNPRDTVYFRSIFIFVTVVAVAYLFFLTLYPS